MCTKVEVGTGRRQVHLVCRWAIGWQQVGVLKRNGEISTDAAEPSQKITFRELAASYLANMEEAFNQRPAHPDHQRVLGAIRSGIR